MSYTQPPALTKEEIEEFILNAKIARICSINKDETIHAVPVWFYYDKGKFFIGSPKNSRRIKNIRRNNKVTILIDEFSSSTKAVIIYGEAKIDDKDMDHTAHSIFKRYMSDEEAEAYWKGLSELTEWVRLIITPTDITSFDYSKDTAYSKAVEKYKT
ncbi:MAG: pyridoxamine 5'-phosphate oxidase family protein [Promethearchaeota archaeon]